MHIISTISYYDRHIDFEQVSFEIVEEEVMKTFRTIETPEFTVHVSKHCDVQVEVGNITHITDEAEIDVLKKIWRYLPTYNHIKKAIGYYRDNYVDEYIAR